MVHVMYTSVSHCVRLSQVVGILVAQQAILIRTMFLSQHIILSKTCTHIIIQIESRHNELTPLTWPLK